MRTVGVLRAETRPEHGGFVYLRASTRVCCLGQCEKATASKLSNSPSLLRRADDRFLLPLQPPAQVSRMPETEHLPVASQSPRVAEEDEQMKASALFGAGVRRLVDSNIVGVLM